MHGGDSSCVALLPSSFSILLDGHSNNNTIAGSSSDGSGIGGNSRYFLAVGIQMLLNGLQTSQLTTESVDTINELISCHLDFRRSRTLLEMPDEEFDA
jgi:homeobox-leucine zipper protein